MTDNNKNKVKSEIGRIKSSLIKPRIMISL